jgi:hypothetical protein
VSEVCQADVKLRPAEVEASLKRNPCRLFGAKTCASLRMRRGDLVLMYEGKASGR